VNILMNLWGQQNVGTFLGSWPTTAPQEGISYIGLINYSSIQTILRLSVKLDLNGLKVSPAASILREVCKMEQTDPSKTLLPIN
jgi:hypothetical protein